MQSEDTEPRDSNIIELARYQAVQVYERKYRVRREMPIWEALKGLDRELGRLERHLLLGGSAGDAVEALRDLQGWCRAWYRRFE